MNILRNKLPIAFFDSGIGGLTVYNEVKKLLPKENYIYFGDTKHLPYGNKSKSELLNYTKFAFDFFAEKGVKATVMACNTTSAAVYEEVNGKYPFKIYPIIQSSAKVIGEQKIKRLGVFATEATVKSRVYETEIKKYSPKTLINQLGCSGWVEIVEYGYKNENPESKTELLKKYLYKMLEFNPEKIILGCTHYPFLKADLIKLVIDTERDIEFIDPAKYFAEFIKKDLTVNDLLNKDSVKGKEEFFVSADPKNFINSSKMFYEIKTGCQLLNI